jgi:predicted nucleotidyltransferase
MIESEEKALAEIVDRLVMAFSPARIILFGSRARGEARPQSDFDLLIVWPDEKPPRFRAAVIRKALAGITLPFDIAVVTPAEFERYRSRPAHVVGIATREGRTLYAA